MDRKAKTSKDAEIDRRSHPYIEFQNTRTWIVVSEAIDDLVDNGDIEETTRREYIVGCIAKKLFESKLIAPDDSPPK